METGFLMQRSINKYLPLHKNVSSLQRVVLTIIQVLRKSLKPLILSSPYFRGYRYYHDSVRPFITFAWFGQYQLQNRDAVDTVVEAVDTIVESTNGAIHGGYSKSCSPPTPSRTKHLKHSKLWDFVDLCDSQWRRVCGHMNPFDLKERCGTWSEYKSIVWQFGQILVKTNQNGVNLSTIQLVYRIKYQRVVDQRSVLYSNYIAVCPFGSALLSEVMIPRFWISFNILDSRVMWNRHFGPTGTYRLVKLSWFPISLCRVMKEFWNYMTGPICISGFDGFMKLFLS